VSAKQNKPARLKQVEASQLLQDLSDQSLRKLAGDKVFARGKVYAANGAVQDLEDLSPTPDYLLGAQAAVHGGELYKTEVWWLPDDDLDGDCDCPHAQDGFFCKHQVALALVWRDQLGGGGDAQTDPQAQKKVTAAAKRAQTLTNNKEALRVFVQSQSATDLAEWLWCWAEQDRHVMAQLKTWQAQVHAAQGVASGDVRAVQTAIHELLKNPKGYLEPRDCAVYQRRAEQAFPLIELMRQISPAQARALCEDMLARVYKVCETADDSWGGEMGDLILNTLEVLKTCLQAEPPPTHWLKTWLSLRAKDPYGLGNTQRIMQAAGPALVQAYSDHLARDWQAWLAANPGAKTEWSHERSAKRSAYLEDLERQGDPALVLEAMRSSVQTAYEWHELVQWCVSHQRWREAFDYAQKAYKLFPQDRRSEADMLAAYERDGWDADALAIHRQRLERDPSSEHYRAALKAAQTSGHDLATYRQSLLDWAQGQERKVERHFWGSKTVEEFVDVSVRVRWYLEVEKDPQAAQSLVEPHGVRCHAALLLTLAEGLPKSQDVQAKRLLLNLFENAMPNASSPYAEVLNLVRLVLNRMTLQDRGPWLASLRTQYKAKRNFTKELPTS
jgi:hypothetical protein